jgi:hypothetical protein
LSQIFGIFDLDLLAKEITAKHAKSAKDKKGFLGELGVLGGSKFQKIRKNPPIRG